jgi:DnaJ-class molecular chaperone
VSLCRIHHPDKRSQNPSGSDEAFKEIGYAFKMLSDPEKRAIYDLGGTAALEEQEGMASVSVDHLLLNILM